MSLHENYFNKVGHFSLDRRMENLPTSETLISSLQRQLGLTNNSSESEVWSTSDLYESIFDAKRKDQIAKIEKHCKIIHSNLDTIELCGGGSARCMMAEVFLPKA